ncbi:MAG TPA: c-type cytochrome [Bryobacteraceae bacterium]|nr:c-type cytochrome [Bryobacteraceae bacterium]
MTPQLRRETAPNSAARWFSRIAWLGIAFNLLFIAMQLLAPDFVNVGVGLSPGASTVWNRAHGVMVLALSILYIPAAVDPLRFPAYSWMLVVSRFSAAVLWAWCLASGQGSFASYLAMDGAFCVVLAVLLQVALPAEAKLPAVLGSLFAAIGAGLQSAYRRTAVRVATAAVVVLLAAAGWAFYDNLLRQQPDLVYPDIVQHYKYASIGLGPSSRIPFWIFKVLPDVFADKLPGPGGYASLGLIVEDGADWPVGFAKRTFGYECLEANCSLCHTAIYRTAAGAKPIVVPGGPAHTLDLQAFQRFLYSAASDSRFNSATLMAAIGKVHQFSPIEGLFYRYLIIPATKVALLEQKAAYAWQESRPPQGRGRTDTFNPTKIVVFHIPDDHTIGTTDLPQVWNQKPRENMWLHWDGNNNQITERNYAAAMAVGATPSSVLPASFGRVTDYLLGLQAPPFPFPIDKQKAARGAAVYQSTCASCHAFGSQGVGQVEDIAQIGTDRHRLDSFSQGLVDRFHTFTTPPFVFTAYRKTNGYSRVPLDGLWLRGPYLHNGSVPNLRALLMPEDQRPKVFYRGYDVLDPMNVGFISDGPEASAVGFRLDTSVPGNSNRGHVYGTTLTDPQKEDLLEYLKTL